MGWADTVKSTALTVLAERTDTDRPGFRRRAVDLESLRRLAVTRQAAWRNAAAQPSVSDSPRTAAPGRCRLAAEIDHARRAAINPQDECSPDPPAAVPDRRPAPRSTSSWRRATRRRP